MWDINISIMPIIVSALGTAKKIIEIESRNSRGKVKRACLGEDTEKNAGKSLSHCFQR